MPTITRRHVIRSLAASGLLLPGLVSELCAEDDPTAPRRPHFAPRAKRVIFLFMTGGVSHVDTFDPKPYLTTHHDLPHGRNAFYKRADWAFRRYGESGMEVSDLFPHVGSVADEICLVRSMRGLDADHFGATIALHTGSNTFNRPSMGSWVSYGLGSPNRNLPSFVVISEGIPYGGGQSWGADFLPVVHQGTRIVPGPEPVSHLSARESSAQQEAKLELLRQFNRAHLRGRESDSALHARLRSFETAHGMQIEAPEVFDLSEETDTTHELYGLERGSTRGFAWQCLVARRLAERGVRFIELIDGDTGVDRNWDTHANMSTYDRLARGVDRPIAGLIRDLRSRGMLDDTLVVWTTEFGRGPFVPSPGTDGRNHHARVFSTWLAGAGVRAGHVHGASDELGEDVAEGLVSTHDLQATILHLLGIDHERLTFRHAGRDFRLTDVHGRVVHEILA